MNLILIIYRIISIFINFIALMLAFSFVMSLPVLLSSPLNLLSSFIIISIILYSWFSHKFSRNVLQLKQPVKPGMRDWIRVNGIVSIIYSSLVIFLVAFVFLNQQIIPELIKNLPKEMEGQEHLINRLFIFMLIYAVLLLVHILLTFRYMKQHIAFFQQPKTE